MPTKAVDLESSASQMPSHTRQLRLCTGPMLGIWAPENRFSKSTKSTSQPASENSSRIQRTLEVMPKTESPAFASSNAWRTYHSTWRLSDYLAWDWSISSPLFTLCKEFLLRNLPVSRWIFWPPNHDATCPLSKLARSSRCLISSPAVCSFRSERQWLMQRQLLQRHELSFRDMQGKGR